jgi:hypothetical protein
VIKLTVEVVNVGKKPEWIEETYTKQLKVDRRLIEYSDRDLHDYILRGLADLDSSELSYIFGIENPAKFLGEGDRLHQHETVEDFAVKDSSPEGEIAIGQVASSNGKKDLYGVSQGYRQINSFGTKIDNTPGIDPEITGYFIVRSKYETEQVKKRNRFLNRDLDMFGTIEIPVDIHRIEPEERNIEESVEKFYSSFTHS